MLVQFYFWYSSSWFIRVWQVCKIVKKSVFWVFRRFSFVYQGNSCLLELPWQSTQTGWVRKKNFIFTLSRGWEVLDQSSQFCFWWEFHFWLSNPIVQSLIQPPWCISTLQGRASFWGWFFKGHYFHHVLPPMPSQTYLPLKVLTSKNHHTKN